MIAILFLVLLAAPGQDAPTVAALTRYHAIVEAYRAGDEEEAIRELEQMPPVMLARAIGAARAESNNALNTLKLKGVNERFFGVAAMLHTDTAEDLWATQRPLSLHHMDLARAWADSAGAPFTARWYLGAGLMLVERGTVQGGVNAALEHFARAFVTLPRDVPLLVTAAWLEERTALAPETWARMPKDYVVAQVAKAHRQLLEEAERRLATALTVDSAAVEAGLRLGRVRTLLGDPARAQGPLSDLVNRPDLSAADAYLARLFLGDSRDAAGDHAAAASLYRDATTRLPSAQAARMALAHRLYADGDAHGAADVAAALVVGAAPAGTDPWNLYLIDHLSRGEPLRETLRAEVRR